MLKFASFHPLTNLIFFAGVIALSMFVMHPVFVAISTVTAFIYSVILKGWESVKFSLKIILPMAVLSVLINILTNRNGATVLCILPFGIEVSIEALIAGVCTAGVVASAILWFTCFNVIITNEKLIYLFGRIMPSVSLILSMILRFVPQFKVQFKQTAFAQCCMGRDISSGNLIERIKNLSVIMSVMMGRVLEGSVEAADSMRGRGYGLKGKTSFNKFKFKVKDAVMILLILLFAAYIILSGAGYSFYPVFTMEISNPVVFLGFFLLCTLPIIMDLQENIKWKYLTSKI